jgi:antitoxin (DNA-binding transcriptional repressor) of toxin-antitoxin stability system
MVDDDLAELYEIPVSRRFYVSVNLRRVGFFKVTFCDLKEGAGTSSTPGTGPRYSFLDRTILSRYKVFMKTLTITDAKKNLGHWLAAAARGEDIGIVCGADIVALRKVDVESTDYAQREYGAIPEQLAALEKATEQRYRRLKQRKKIASITPQELRKMIE